MMNQETMAKIERLIKKKIARPITSQKGVVDFHEVELGNYGETYLNSIGWKKIAENELEDGYFSYTFRRIE